MTRRPIPRSEEEETGRETRLKLILLGVALILVAVYATLVTSVGDLVVRQAVRFVGSGLLLATLGAVLGAGVLAGIAYLGVRRLRARVKSKPSIPAAYAPVKVASRKEFMSTLDSQIASHVKAGRQLALHLIDVDRFRVVNAILGENEGDALLRLIGERLLILVDVPERLARIGDDEFAIIQPEASGGRHAEIFAHRVEEALKDVFAQIPRNARPSASIGIAVAPDHGNNAAALVHCASLALRAAKKMGGTEVRVFGREMEIAMESRRQMETAISEGLNQSWFHLHFQPQYDLGTKRLTGFEALVRMRHPELGGIEPTVFVPIADDSGLILPLGEWIIGEALTTASAWPDHMTLSINISLAQFRDSDVSGTILHALGNSSFDAARLRVEIPEAVLLEESEAINEQLQRLRSRGIAVVLDDFGLDTSNLRLLTRELCDEVKLDRSLVQRVGEAPEMEGLVRSLIGTAKSFGLNLLAEGVERPEQAHFLVSNDCRKVQGYLFGRPVSATDLAAIIAKDAKNAMDEKKPRERASSAA
jgi:diguanylate cyclase (GGDEF)-like protein